MVDKDLYILEVLKFELKVQKNYRDYLFSNVLKIRALESKDKPKITYDEKLSDTMDKIKYLSQEISRIEENLNNEAESETERDEMEQRQGVSE